MQGLSLTGVYVNVERSYLTQVVLIRLGIIASTNRLGIVASGYGTGLGMLALGR